MPQNDAVTDDADDGVLDFLDHQKAKLGKAPIWAHHLHDCMHEAKQEVARLRHKTANRDMAVDGKFRTLENKMDLLIALFGSESDDGEGGRGIIGEVRRQGQRLKSLESDRNKFWGVIAALTATAALLAAGAKAWIEAVVRGIK